MKALVPVRRESRLDQTLSPSMARRIKVFFVTLQTPLLACRRVRKSDISLMERPLKSRTNASSVSARSSLSSQTICCLFSRVRPMMIGSDRGTSRTCGRSSLKNETRPRSNPISQGRKNVARLPRRELLDQRTNERSKIRPAVSGRAHARIGFRQ